MFHSVTNIPLTLSIIIPAYNEERHLPACLEAIAAQSVMPDEVIIVDNNSTDQTVDIAQKYPFVKIINERQQGIAYARNAGFNSSSGDIIARIDADTVLPVDWVSKIHKYYAAGRHQNYALTGGGYFYNVRMPRFNGWVLSQVMYRLNRFIAGHYILWGSNMALLRSQWREVCEEVCNGNDIHEDIDLAIHLRRHHYRIVYEAKALRVGVYMKRIYSDRISLQGHLHRWPETFRQHGYRLWWLGVVGYKTLVYIAQPIGLMLEGAARLLGKKSITK